ncbi:MAG: transposase, partial [Bacteroidetes bacterium]|nr:transposase [Bacteroidota bacterium]
SSEIFTTLADAQLLCARWRADYNHRRPQRALGKQTPAEYAAKCEVSAARRLVQRMEMTGKTLKAASIMIAETS